MFGLVKSLNRIATLVGKELIQVRRRPGALLSLVFGPFVILAVFGLGYTGVHRPLSVIIVMPTDVAISRDVGFYQDIGGPAVTVVDITDDAAAAEQQLADRAVDAVLRVPGDIAATVRSGKQIELLVEINEVDPVGVQYADFMAGYITQRVNREILTRALTEGESYLRREGGELVDIDPQLIAAPTTARTVNVAPSAPGIVAFAAPAVLALILQHMAVTLTALSLVRERLSGTFELFRVSPVNSIEVLAAKYVGLGLLSALIAVVTVALVVGPLGVPLLGSSLLVAGVIALLVFASLGIGLLISVVSDSERQAVQLALLLLIASVFFSGLVLPVDEFSPPVQVFAYLLPVTHGIDLLQSLMLRGTIDQWWEVANLAAIGAVLFVVTTFQVRRQLRRA
jgi:ABC-2 type transport system permease protein